MKIFPLIFLFFSLAFVPNLVFAQGLLPTTELSDAACEVLSSHSFSDVSQQVQSGGGYNVDYQEPDLDEHGNYKLNEKDEIIILQRTATVKTMDDVLGCALRTGRFRLAMLPFIILYAIKLFSGLAGVLSVLFIVIGAYHFMIGSLTEEKEKGKKTILHALLGFGLSLLAYTIVNLVQIAVSS